MSQKVSGLLAYIYSIPDFLASANFCRIFSLAPAGNRHSAAVSGRIFVSWPSEPGIPPAAFRTIISLYRDRRAKPPASHCTSFRLDRPALSRPPYLLYRANLGLPFVNNVSFQAPSAPAITFQEPQVNLPHLILLARNQWGRFTSLFSRKGRVGCCRIYPCRGKRQTRPVLRVIKKNKA